MTFRLPPLLWSACLLLLAAPSFGDTIRRLSLPTSDLIYDPVGQKIYASIPGDVEEIGNTITAIDPATGKLGSSVFIGSEPGTLALSDTARDLYVALDGAAAVRRYDLATETLGVQFALGSGNSGLFYARDIEVMPGNPNVVAVSRRNLSSSPDFEGVVIYENGVPRPVSIPGPLGSERIEFSASGSVLYGYEWGHTGDFYQLAVDETGVTQTAKTSGLISGFGTDIEFEGGLIYSTNGDVVDPVARKRIAVMKDAAGLVRPDAASQRVYFLTGAGSAWTLRAYDISTFLPMGSLTISGVKGTPSSLIRWGDDGLAFRTSGDQVFLIHTSLVPSRLPSVDLAVTQTATPFPARVGQPVTFKLDVKNQGFDPATEISLVNVLSPDMTFVSVASTQGTCAESGGTLECALGTLNFGAQSTVFVTATPKLTGSFTNTVRVAGRQTDPDRSNNVSDLELPVQFGLAPGEIGQVRLGVNDLIYDPIRGKLLASSSDPAGRILEIDPVTGIWSVLCEVGQNPGQIKLTEDGQYLYVAVEDPDAKEVYLFNRSIIQRVDLSLRTVDLTFPLGKNAESKPYGVQDMEALPGRPDSIAVALSYMEGVAVFDHGVMRPKKARGGYGTSVIEFGAGSSHLYGYQHDSSSFEFQSMMVDESGVSMDVERQNLIEGYKEDIEFAQGQIYSTSGVVLDAARLARLYDFKKLGPQIGLDQMTLVEPDPSVNRVFYLVQGDSTHQLLAFRRNAPALLGAIDLPVTAWATHLVRWGEDGLAYSTGDNRIMLLRTAFRPSKGDVNRDGKVDVSDAVTILKSIVGLESPDPDGSSLADLSGDDTVDISDVILLLRRIVEA